MPPRRRSPVRRLVLTLAALTSLIVGYYLGQAWQRKPLADLSAIVYPNGMPVTYPAGLDLDRAGDDWRLFLTADTGRPACRELRLRYGLVLNRLAYRPSIQQRLRLGVLAYDRPDSAAVETFVGGQSWIDVIRADRATLDRLSSELGILPTSRAWCTDAQANAVLVAPDATAWALIPREQPDTMAHNIATIIEFVE